MELCEIVKFIEELSQDAVILPKNVRAELEKIRVVLNCPDVDVPMRIDAALERLEELSMDPNVSVSGRSELWNLTSALEGLNQR